MTSPSAFRPFRALRATLAIVASVVVAAACATTAPTGSPSGSPSASLASPSGADPGSSPAAVLPIVIDTDLAADDLLAIMVLLRQPGVDVRAVTVSGTGEVRCPAGLRNARRLLAAFGRGDVPVACGRENPGAGGRWFPSEWRDGADAFYGIELPEVAGESSRDGDDAPTLLARLASEARAAGDPLTLVPIGPWTNLADALALDPAFATNLAGIHTMGGTIDAQGNIDIGTTSPSDMVEWNFGVDPEALAEILATEVPVTMVGLDATNDVPVPSDIVSTLEADAEAVGASIAHEMYLRNPFLSEGSSFWDTLAAVLLVDPSVATWEDVPVRVETDGRSAGRTARDPAGRIVRAAMSADRERFMAAFLSALRTGPARAGGLVIAGTLAVTWDGTTCRRTSTPDRAGDALVTIQNEAETTAGMAVGRVAEPHTWAEALAWIQAADLSDPTLTPPDWVVPIQAAMTMQGPASATVVSTMEAGSYGVACAIGTFPDIEFVDAGAFEVAG